MNERLTGLKRVTVFGAAFGAGAVLTVALVFGMGALVSIASRAVAH